MDFIYKQHPYLSGLDFNTNEPETHLFFGQIQSGKTHMLLSACYLSQCAGRLTLFMIPNLCTAWYGQLVHRIDSFNKMVERPLVVTYVGDSTEEELIEIITSNIPQVLVFLSNPHQLEIVNKLGLTEFNLLIDEADQMYKQENTVFYPSFQKLIELSKWTGIISATTYKLWFQTNVKTTYTHKIEPPVNYKGLFHFNTQLSSKTEKYTSLSRGDISKCDLSFTEWCEELIEEQPYLYGDNKKMPIIALYKGTDEIAIHHQIQMYLKRTYQQFTTLTYDSKGICIYGLTLTEPFIKINGEIVKRKRELYECKKSSLADVLQYLKDNGGVERFPRILIIAGKLANRMFSFVSKDYEWHLTHQRLYMSPATDCTTLLQSLRLCGVYNDTVPLTLSCSVNIYQTLMKAEQFQSLMLDEAMKDDREEVLMKDFVKEKHIEKQHVPKRKLVAGYSYNKEIGCIEPYEEDLERIDNEEKGLRLLLEKIYEKWSLRDNEDAPAYLRIIGLFANHERLEKDTIIQQARLSNFSHYTKWNLKRHNQYKLLIKDENSYYKLHPIVKQNVERLSNQ